MIIRTFKIGNNCVGVCEINNIIYNIFGTSKEEVINKISNLKSKV